MGMQSWRDDLEDLSFRILEPVSRSSIIRHFVTIRNRATGWSGSPDEVIENVHIDINALLEAAHIEAEVESRKKSPFSIWRKMKEKQGGFSSIFDVYGFRIITDDEDAVYRALGAVHKKWAAIPGRFKDYISQPKSNGYRSIHTTVSGYEGNRVEIQIRTRLMHQVAQSGVAAHWSYRDGVRVKNPYAVDPCNWLSKMSEDFANVEDHGEFLEHIKLEMSPENVFCFTPRGDVVRLPVGATPLDFGYAIHTGIRR